MHWSLFSHSVHYDQQYMHHKESIQSKRVLYAKTFFASYQLLVWQIGDGKVSFTDLVVAHMWVTNPKIIYIAGQRINKHCVWT